MVAEELILSDMVTATGTAPTRAKPVPMPTTTSGPFEADITDGISYNCVVTWGNLSKLGVVVYLLGSRRCGTQIHQTGNRKSTADKQLVTVGD